MKHVLLYLMVLLYLVAGIYHFVNPQFYVSIMPLWMPAKMNLVYISGLAEIMLALLLLPQKTRSISSILIILMLIVFFFLIHLPMALDFYATKNPYLWIAIVRLPVQLLLIGWAAYIRKSVNLQKK